MLKYQSWTPESASEIIAHYQNEKGAMLPILHALQEAFGCVPLDAEPLIAEALNVTRAEVHGCVTFYHDYKRKPPGRHTLKLCLAESCQASGVRALEKRAKEKLGIEMGGTTADDRVTLEPVYCLGLCHSSPAAMLDDDVYAALDEERLDELLKEAQS